MERVDLQAQREELNELRVSLQSPCAKESPVRRDGHLAWAELMARVWEVDVFRCGRCGTHGMQRIATIVDHNAVRQILRAVGIPTDPPTQSPYARRSAEELFVD